MFCRGNCFPGTPLIYIAIEQSVLWCVQKTTIQDQGRGGDYWHPSAQRFYLPVLSFPTSGTMQVREKTICIWLVISLSVQLTRKLAAYLCKTVCMYNKMLKTIKKSAHYAAKSHIYIKLPAFTLKCKLICAWLECR